MNEQGTKGGVSWEDPPHRPNDAPKLPRAKPHSPMAHHRGQVPMEAKETGPRGLLASPLVGLLAQLWRWGWTEEGSNIVCLALFAWLAGVACGAWMVVVAR